MCITDMKLMSQWKKVSVFNNIFSIDLFYERSHMRSSCKSMAHFAGFKPPASCLHQMKRRMAQCLLVY